MNTIAVAFPLLPGKREALSTFAQTLMTERKADFERSQVSVSRESWYVQPTPVGDLIIAYFEAPDIAAVFEGLAISEEPFDIWFRDQIQNVTGVDMSKPPEGWSERIFNWERA